MGDSYRIATANHKACAASAPIGFAALIVIRDLPSRAPFLTPESYQATLWAKVWISGPKKQKPLEFKGLALGCLLIKRLLVAALVRFRLARQWLNALLNRRARERGSKVNINESSITSSTFSTDSSAKKKSKTDSSSEQGRFVNSNNRGL